MMGLRLQTIAREKVKKRLSHRANDIQKPYRVPTIHNRQLNMKTDFSTLWYVKIYDGVKEPYWISGYGEFKMMKLARRCFGDVRILDIESKKSKLTW